MKYTFIVQSLHKYTLYLYTHIFSHFSAFYLTVCIFPEMENGLLKSYSHIKPNCMSNHMKSWRHAWKNNSSRLSQAHKEYSWLE